MIDMIVLSGASASGKTEVAKMLAKKYGITKVITTTTREMRIHEENGRDYFFVNKEEFEEMLKDDLFVETTFYNNNYYGSLKSQIANDKCVVIDPNGLKSYIALNNKTVVTFFLDSSEEVRYQRMLLRGDNEEKAKERIRNDRTAFANNVVVPVDYHIESEIHNVEEVTDEIYQLYKRELEKRHLIK